jgi:transposase
VRVRWLSLSRLHRHRYVRFRAAGKLPKVALVAVMLKLLTIINAMVRDNRPWNSKLTVAEQPQTGALGIPQGT